MTLKQKPRESEGLGHAKSWGKSVPGGGISRAKAWWEWGPGSCLLSNPSQRAEAREPEATVPGLRCLNYSVLRNVGDEGLTG